jgi:hypothetical protein
VAVGLVDLQSITPVRTQVLEEELQALGNDGSFFDPLGGRGEPRRRICRWAPSGALGGGSAFIHLETDARVVP